MRRLPWFALVGSAALVAGCGDHRLVLDVDVLSYLDPASARASFGPVPAVPGGATTGEQAVFANRDVNLLEGLSSAVQVDAVSLSLAAEVADSTGSGSDTLRVYLSSPDVDPRSTPPVIARAVPMAPGVTDTVRVSVDGDPRVAELFAARRMRMTFTMALRGPESGAALNGRVRLTALRAVVIGSRTGW